VKRIGLIAVLVVALAGLTGPAGAGPIVLDFDYSPTSGPAGTVITASGNCYDFFAKPAALADAPAGFLTSGTVTLELSDGTQTLASDTVAMGDDGDWEAMVTVPANTPAGDYDLDATCFVLFESEEGARATEAADQALGLDEEYVYATQPFAVTAQPATTAGPTTSAGPTTTAPAVAAQALRTQPAFTG
jgi:hypothetical protein